jgi:hypothetical protein
MAIFESGMTRVAFNSFVRRQTAESPFSDWDLTDEQLLRAVEINLDNGIPGYRDGVLIVPVPPYGFRTGLVTLREGDELVGRFEARRPGEEPRKSVYASRVSMTLLSSSEECDIYVDEYREKMPARAVEIILYRHDVLAENGDAETDAEWEIISVNARTTLGEAPIAPMVLMYNHFGSDGGTSTNMTPEEFEAQLRVSFEFWKDKALLAP